MPKNTVDRAPPTTTFRLFKQKGRCSRTAYLESEQHVARNAAPLRVARIYVDHAVDNYRAGSIDSTAVRRYAIDRGVIARRIELPKQSSVVCRVGALITAYAASENNPGNYGNRCR